MEIVKLQIPTHVQQTMNLLRDNGFEIYIVGGIVRDAFLGRPLIDWDMTTNATPETMLELIPDSFYDNKFGTVGVKDEIKPLEITTFRTEQGYSDSRHPDNIKWGKSLEEDLQRRDFTINSMALKQLSSQSSNNTGFELIDIFGGKQDLSNKLIKAVGDPIERFKEDALRMMRAVRIGAQLHFSIEDNTFSAIQAQAPHIADIAWERIRDELLKILASEYPADGYLLMRNCGLAAYILPEMETTFGVEQKSPGRHHIYDVGTHSVEALRFCPSPDPITRLATLVHDVGKVKTQKIFPDGRITFYNHEMESEKIAYKIAERLKFSNEQKDKFVKLIRWHQFSVDEHQTDSALRRFIKNVGKEYITDMLALRTGDRLGGGARETSWRLEEFKKRLTDVQKQPFDIPDLKVNGKDIMELKGIEPGPQVGGYLSDLFKMVTEEGIPNDREVLLNKLKEL